MASCGTPVTILTVNTPSTATPGVPFTATVTALADDKLDKIFNMDVHFTSSDSSAILPADYTFTATDAGSHTFTNRITLMTLGTQTVTATATFAHSITGTAIVTVQNAPDKPSHAAVNKSTVLTASISEQLPK
jgi:adhesin/invasin